ncbi:phage tail protein [Mastigocoleus testarum]|uniref:Phage tail protein n=1 Tax=Mastigocoleus testarum BC008 TaxID=371196 RepID=A0A0V7ZCJ1_9CYAN|nr:phage tail protein [Mastigocoleus testarum]KST62203.1 phage tail protein [Mastigocoleus testarum BC008]KST64833.1 phage tail protein [Mastigocoleus testarum BC008]
MVVGVRKDPYRAYNFLVEIDGITRAGFRECSGLDSAQDPIEYREGNEKYLTVRKLTGLVKYSNISLKYGVTDDVEIWDWRTKAVEGQVERKNGSIVLLDDLGQEKMRWNFREGWPTKWTGTSFNATGNEVAIETLEIAHEGISKG